jgi:choline dehydrogenase-like flavoprotein
MQRDRVLNFGLRFRLVEPDPFMGFKERLRDLVCASEWTLEAVNELRGKSLSCLRVMDGRLDLASEQAPNRLSRITLGSELDRFDMRRIKLNWQLSAIDVHTIQRAVFRFGQVFADLGLGRVRVNDWLSSDDPQFPGSGGHHHMCTTRMGASPDKGVVNSNQRVFGIDNLYIAGSSVFSTGGHANPTFTIVQLSLRLADHIRRLPKL